MTPMTDRLALPLLAAAQAQKEVTHNEALALLDALVQPVVVAVAPVAIPGTPSAGQGWIVGPAPTGDWAGYADALAVWTAGGWRFARAFDGMSVWSQSDSMMWRFGPSGWVRGMVSGTSLVLGGVQVVGARGATIAPPGGGTIIDTEARSAISSIITAMKTHGLIAP